MKHKDCEGQYALFTIDAHNFSYLQCDKCFEYLGGDKVKQTIARLLNTQVYPKAIFRGYIG